MLKHVFSCLRKYRTVAPDSPRRCIVMHLTVYTVVSGDHPFSAALAEAKWSPPKGRWCTGQGVTVPPEAAPHPLLSLL